MDIRINKFELAFSFRDRWFYMQIPGVIGCSYGCTGNWWIVDWYWLERKGKTSLL